MAGIAQSRHKCLIFIVVTLLRLKKIKRDGKNRKIYSKYKRYIQVKMVQSLK